MDGQQQNLDFSSALNERLAEIRSMERAPALVALGPGRMAGVIELLERIVICSTDRETSEARVSSLAARVQSRRAYGERTIRNWARDAESLGLIVVDRRSHRFGGHRPNVWRLQRDRVLELVASAREVQSGGTTAGNSAGSGAATGRQPLPPQGGNACSPRAAKIAALTLGSSGRKHVEEENSGPVREGGNGPGVVLRRTAQGERSDRGEPAYQPTAGTACPEVRQELLEDHPLLREACRRSVEALPPDDLVGNAFAPLAESELKDPVKVTGWFRRQLAVRRPLTPPTEADLLLVLAAASWASKMPADQVRKSRKGAFVDTVLRGRWRRVASHVGRAHEFLEAFREEFPECLTCPTGRGPRVEEVTTTEG